MVATKARKRKAPITQAISRSKTIRATGSVSRTPQAKRTSVIRRFHVLIKRRAQLEKHKACAETDFEISEIDQEMKSLGGLEAYQRMSIIGQSDERGGGSQKVLIGWLKELGLHNREETIRLLEVGALKHDNYASCSDWIACHPMDLRSQHPLITEQDFLNMLDDPNDEMKHKESWDAISLSLVVNFVPEPRDRGRMLSMAHTMLKTDGLLFLALPLPCVSNSRYMTFEHLSQLMEILGFEKLRERWKDGGKMAYWLFKKRVLPDVAQLRVVAHFDKKVVLRTGGHRNNFSILV